MARWITWRAHGLKRARPAELVPGTLSVVTARMDYLPRDTPADWPAREWQRLGQPEQAAVALYARGRDYHKVLRQRLQQLADRLADAVGPFGHRVFTDSAPVLEVELAARSGIGWRGKHTLALDRRGRLDVLPRRDLRRPGAAADTAGRAALRQLQRLHRRLPDAGDRRPVPARCAALHLLPDDRAEGGHSRWSSAPRSATASTAATTASSSARGTSTRSAARCPTSTRGRRSPRRRCSSSGPGTRPSSCAAARAARSAASASSAGSAISRSASAMPCARPATPRSPTPCARAATSASAMVREHIDWALAQAPAAAAVDVAADQETRRSTASQSGMLTMPSTVETVTRPATKLPSPPMRAAST